MNAIIIYRIIADKFKPKCYLQCEEILNEIDLINVENLLIVWFCFLYVVRDKCSLVISCVFFVLIFESLYKTANIKEAQTTSRTYICFVDLLDINGLWIWHDSYRKSQKYSSQSTTFRASLAKLTINCSNLLHPLLLTIVITPRFSTSWILCQIFCSNNIFFIWFYRYSLENICLFIFMFS